MKRRTSHLRLASLVLSALYSAGCGRAPSPAPANAASAASVSSASSTAFTIPNGTFETPALPALPGHQYQPAGTGWTPFTSGNPPAPEGAQVLFLQKDAGVMAMLNPRCTSYERSWGEWCVYTYKDDRPDVLFPGFDNVYHASVWRRESKWHAVIGGWRHPASEQGYHDRIFHLQTADPYGIGGWTLIPGAGGTPHMIGNDFENDISNDMPSDIKKDRDGNDVTLHHSFHTIQPHVVPAAELPGSFSCCDTVFYSYDYVGDFPERGVGMHWAYWDSAGALKRAGGLPGLDKNPVLNWHSFDYLPGPVVAGTSDGRVTFDPMTSRFYMFFDEWFGGPDAGAAVTSVASASWTNKKFSVVARDIGSALGNARFLGNPHLVIKNGQYILFFTRFINDGAEIRSEIHAVTASAILGPYGNERIILRVPSGQALYGLGTPFVFCNTQLNMWQMYFNGSTHAISDNQVFTAFLRKDCSQIPLE